MWMARSSFVHEILSLSASTTSFSGPCLKCNRSKGKMISPLAETQLKYYKIYKDSNSEAVDQRSKLNKNI